MRAAWPPRGGGEAGRLVIADRRQRAERHPAATEQATRAPDPRRHALPIDHGSSAQASLTTIVLDVRGALRLPIQWGLACFRRCEAIVPGASTAFTVGTATARTSAAFGLRLLAHSAAILRSIYGRARATRSDGTSLRCTHRRRVHIESEIHGRAPSALATRSRGSAALPYLCIAVALADFIGLEEVEGVSVDVRGEHVERPGLALDDVWLGFTPSTARLLEKLSHLRLDLERRWRVPELPVPPTADDVVAFVRLCLPVVVEARPPEAVEQLGVALQPVWSADVAVFQAQLPIGLDVCDILVDRQAAIGREAGTSTDEQHVGTCQSTRDACAPPRELIH
mmetsp:Transcript_3729/g.9626  ORF Transcript_3729/g.9626 Transcript_3729/m.9626 type:complete len:339 (+) Transcript_3729:993-2009(+)